MKYFLPEYINSYRAPLDLWKRYHRDILSVADKLPFGLRALVSAGGAMSLHDSRVQNVFVDVVSRCIALELHGDIELHDEMTSTVTNTDAPTGLTLKYIDASVFSINFHAPRDVGGIGDHQFDEFEVINPALFEHRLLFSSAAEFKITARDGDIKTRNIATEMSSHRRVYGNELVGGSDTSNDGPYWSWYRYDLQRCPPPHVHIGERNRRSTIYADGSSWDAESLTPLSTQLHEFMLRKFRKILSFLYAPEEDIGRYMSEWTSDAQERLRIYSFKRFGTTLEELDIVGGAISLHDTSIADFSFDFEARSCTIKMVGLFWSQPTMSVAGKHGRLSYINVTSLLISNSLRYTLAESAVVGLSKHQLTIDSDGTLTHNLIFGDGTSYTIKASAAHFIPDW